MKPKSRIWVISDLHFSHEKILKYTKRPYKNINEMHNALINNWNKIVDDDDIVIVLGDFCWANNARDVFNYTKRLRGNKILVRGNHERLGITSYYSAGFNFVCDSFTLKFAQKKIMFVHDPDRVAQSDYERYDVFLYGHTHDKTFSKCKEKFVNVCVEQTHFKPVLLNSIVNKFQKHNVRRERRKTEHQLEVQYREGFYEVTDEDIELATKAGQLIRSRHNQ